MMKLNDKNPGALEFTIFEKNVAVTDEDLITAEMQFENNYLKNCKGLIFHCLVRNLKGQYANVLFAENLNSLKEAEKGFSENLAAKEFLQCINHTSVKVFYHEILKNNFTVPETFGCIEHGLFTVKSDSFSEDNLLKASEDIEKKYLSSFSENSGHFMGKINTETYSEIAFGSTLGKTREICFGYVNNPVCQPLLNMFIPESVNLDFWTVIA